MARTGTSRIAGLDANNHALLATLGHGAEVARWIPREQHLRWVRAGFDHTCAGDWQQLRELCAAGVAPVCGRDYARLFRGDPSQIFSAISVLWRAAHNFGSAVAYTDESGTTITMIDCPVIDEIEGNANAGWLMGVARCAGVEIDRIELRRRPWVGEGDEQVVRVHWREQLHARTPRRSAIAS